MKTHQMRKARLRIQGLLQQGPLSPSQGCGRDSEVGTRAGALCGGKGGAPGVPTAGSELWAREAVQRLLKGPPPVSGTHLPLSG